jgi:hypothetical protein
VRKRVVPYPDEAQAYLEKKYGLKPFSGKHLDRKVENGTFPRPIVVSPRRRVSRIDDLDTYAKTLIKNL